jgi:hypothetical protein
MDLVIPFTLTAAQINTLDTAPVSLVSGMKSTYVYIPKRLALKKAAGTAYTLSLLHDIGSQRDDSAISLESDSHVHGFNSGILVSEVRRAIGTSFEERAVFWTPSRGFLDSSQARTKVVLPRPELQEFNEGSSRFRIQVMDTISGGTGSVEGWLYFEEHAIGR